MVEAHFYAFFFVLSSFLTNEDEGREEVGGLFRERGDVEDAAFLVCHDLDVVEVAGLFVEPLCHLSDVDTPLAGHTTLASKILTYVCQYVCLPASRHNCRKRRFNPG